MILRMDQRFAATGAQASRLLRARATPLAEVARRACARQQISSVKFVCVAALATDKQDVCAPVKNQKGQEPKLLTFSLAVLYQPLQLTYLDRNGKQVM